MISFLDFWGSGNARMRKLDPATRIVCGVGVFSSCLVLPICHPAGAAILGAAVIGWSLLCGIPWKTAGGLLLYALLLFLPLFILTPWIELHPSSGANGYGAASVPLEIGLRGTACIFICASTIAILDLAEFNQGLSRLPVPRTITSLIMQIVHQTAMLTNESRRIASAMQVRGLPSGYMARLRFLPALPTFWLLRIMNRVERIGAAMELRGFELPANTARRSLSLPDVFAMAAVVLLLGAALTIRGLNSL